MRLDRSGFEPILQACSSVAAASIHVCSPLLEAMHHYELTDESELRVMRRELVEKES